MTQALGNIQLQAAYLQRLIEGESVGNPQFQDYQNAKILSTSTNSFYAGTAVKLVGTETAPNSQASIDIVEKASVTDEIYGYLVFTRDLGYINRPFIVGSVNLLLRPSPYAQIIKKAGAAINCTAGQIPLMLDSNGNVIPYVNNGTNKICGYALENAVTNSLVRIALGSKKIA